MFGGHLPAAPGGKPRRVGMQTEKDTERRSRALYGCLQSSRVFDYFRSFFFSDFASRSIGYNVGIFELLGHIWKRNGHSTPYVSPFLPRLLRPHLLRPKDKYSISELIRAVKLKFSNLTNCAERALGSL